MVVVSAADGSMDDGELRAIGDIVRHLPAFAYFNEEELPAIGQTYVELLNDGDGFETVITLISENLPPKLRETAYAIACDIAAAAPVTRRSRSANGRFRGLIDTFTAPCQSPPNGDWQV
tara:strand:+ start:1117 stop:1473 length:357 start_codon:yes stop_codon:yes gene_type:complete